MKLANVHIINLIVLEIIHVRGKNKKNVAQFYYFFSKLGVDPLLEAIERISFLWPQRLLSGI